MIKYFLLLMLFVIPICVNAQSDSTGIIQDFLEDAVQDNEDSQIYDVFESLINNPVPINSASINDLLQIPFINPTQAKDIIDYRNETGGIHSFDEFYKIKSINSELVDKIKPFIELEESSGTKFYNSFLDVFNNTNYLLRSRITQNLEAQKNITENNFMGTRQKVYNRIIFNTGENFRAGFLIEKDAGEKSLSDFASFNFAFKNISVFKNIIFGDYTFEFGHGLALWGPYGVPKGSAATSNSIRNARGAVPFTGSDENRFLRGSAFQIDYGNFIICPFFSSHFIDASIDSFSNGVNSLIIDGYHRSANELAKKNKLKETILGISSIFNLSDNLNIGLLYYNLSYDHILNSNKKNNFRYFSATYNSSPRNFYFTGEFASDFTSVSSINTAEYFVNKNFSLLFSYRNYSQDYYCNRANSFGEKISANNENGFYTGLRLRTGFGLFNFYYDQFNFPAAYSNYNFSSDGKDILFYYTHTIFRNTEIKLRYKIEDKDLLTDNGLTFALEKRRSQKIRLEISHAVSKYLRLKSRIEYGRLNPINSLPEESGYLFFQDFSYNTENNLSFRGRVVFFQTDSYNSRLYEFENDLTGVMTNLPLYGDGMRWYFLIIYKSSLGLNLSLKYSETYKPPSKNPESNNSINERYLDNRLSLQIDFMF